MKATLLQTAVQNGARRIPMALVAAVAMTFLHQNAMANPTTVNLGTASSFAILAYSEITDAGGASTITGNVGLSPTTGTFIGLTTGQVGGTIYAVDTSGPAGVAGNNPGLLTTATGNLGLSGAYNDAFSRTPTTPSYGTTDKALDGLTLPSGVYNFGHAATANLTTTLTLDAGGDPNAVWIFQATSDLVTGSGSKVVFLNGVGSPCNVFWVVGSSATLGTYTDFIGNIMAYASVGLDTGATLDGSALAENAAVTLDHNTITQEDCSANGGGSSVPDTGSTLLLLGSGLATLLAFKRWFFSPA
jgi:hypothetical protein